MSTQDIKKVVQAYEVPSEEKTTEVKEETPHADATVDVENMASSLDDGSLEQSKEKINEAFTKISKKQSKKILEITKEKLVSIDFNHNSASAIIDASLTSVVGKNMGKISAWYDNEWGFSNRMCDIAEHLHEIS